MLTVAIAGKHLQSRQLIPDGASPHHYSLKPSDIKQLHNAQIIFRIDEELESFLNKSLQQVSKSTQIISLADIEGIHLLPINHQKTHKSAEHIHNSHDLHIWLNPNNAIVISKIIAAKLSKIDPAHGDDYRNNLDQLISKIQTADKELKEKLKPIAETPFIVFHNAWGYFEKHYGLKNVSVINQAPTRQLGAAKIKAIREEIKAKKIVCLFSEPQLQPEIIQTLIKGSYVKVVELDVLGSQINIDSNSYIELLNTLSNGFLSCKK